MEYKQKIEVQEEKQPLGLKPREPARRPSSPQQKEPAKVVETATESEELEEPVQQQQ